MLRVYHISATGVSSDFSGHSPQVREETYERFNSELERLTSDGGGTYRIINFKQGWVDRAVFSISADVEQSCTHPNKLRKSCYKV